MLSYTFLATLLIPAALSAPTSTVAKIRGVRDPVYHLYLQAHPENASVPVLGPESGADEFSIGETIQSRETSRYLNIQTASTSYKPLAWEATGTTTAWGFEGDTIVNEQGSSYGRRE